MTIRFYGFGPHLTDEMKHTNALRVECGVAFLDEVMPDWRTRVNVDTLDLSSPQDCVVGQIVSGIHDELEFSNVVSFKGASAAYIHSQHESIDINFGLDTLDIRTVKSLFMTYDEAKRRGFSIDFDRRYPHTHDNEEILYDAAVGHDEDYQHLTELWKKEITG